MWRYNYAYGIPQRGGYYRNGNELYHFGTREHSGRYPWGSGSRPFQRLEGAGQKIKAKIKVAAPKVKKVAIKGAKIATKVAMNMALTSLIGGAGYASYALGRNYLLNLGLKRMNSNVVKAFLREYEHPQNRTGLIWLLKNVIPDEVSAWLNGLPGDWKYDVNKVTEGSSTYYRSGNQGLIVTNNPFAYYR